MVHLVLPSEPTLAFLIPSHNLNESRRFITPSGKKIQVRKGERAPFSISPWGSAMRRQSGLSIAKRLSWK
jgi:hypothetical protein